MKTTNNDTSLADRLADAVIELRTLLKAYGLGDHTGKEALTLWKESRKEYPSQRIVDDDADGKSDGQEENANSPDAGATGK
jgi:hypothetical protein